MRSSSSLFGKTTRPCTRSSITVSPSRGALKRMTGVTPAGASPGRGRARCRHSAARFPAFARCSRMAAAPPACIAAIGLAPRQQLLARPRDAARRGRIERRARRPSRARASSSPSRMASTAASVERSRSVSSMRSSILPPCAGIEPVEQRGARAANMQEAGGRGGKACETVELIGQAKP